MTPGREVAGVVDAAADGPGQAWLGRRVVVHLGAASGGYATMAVADVEALFPLADSIDFAAAVAMVGTGRTTVGVVETAEPVAGDVALVTAAAGGIGALLVQALRRAGAIVVGVARGAGKVRVVEGLGAHVAVDYDDDGWPDRVRKALDGRDVTLALDGVGGDIGRSAFELVGAGGRMVLFGYSAGAPMVLTADDLFTTGVTVTAAVGPRMTARPGGIRGLAEQALSELEAGRLVPLVNPPFPLAAAADAHRALEGRATTGKVVLVP
jgi:NADPH2:quinone reductase